MEPGGEYDAMILVVSKEYSEMSFFVSTHMSLSEQNCSIFTDAFLDSFKVTVTRFCPNT